MQDKSQVIGAEARFGCGKLAERYGLIRRKQSASQTLCSSDNGGCNPEPMKRGAAKLAHQAVHILRELEISVQLDGCKGQVGTVLHREVRVMHLVPKRGPPDVLASWYIVVRW